SNVPVLVGGTGGTGVASVAAGNNHIVARKTDGTVWAWGSGSSGQLGNALTAQSNVPVQVVGPSGIGSFLTGIASVAAGDDHSVAVKSDGTVWSWGANNNGQLGRDAAGAGVPGQVVGPNETGFLMGVSTGAAGLASGLNHLVVLKGDGTVWAWGGGGSGQMGNGFTANYTAPHTVAGLTGVTGLAAGDSHSVAVKSDGTVWAWGQNSSGQLGDNTTNDSLRPVQVVGPGGSQFLTGIVAVSAGGNFSSGSHSVALKSDGTVWTWGASSFGELGNNTTTSSSTPVQVLGPGGSGFLTGIVAVTMSSVHSIAVKSDGTAWAWGASGRMGNTGVGTSLTPVQVMGPIGTDFMTGVAGVAAGQHSLLVKGDGTVWA
ncbi:MAG: hypothetical protein NTZ05_07155, partial [Chloroflexi bacterium]|nr:hypothetical protein [Chloroflexota bacterium]